MKIRFLTLVALFAFCLSLGLVSPGSVSINGTVIKIANEAITKGKKDKKEKKEKKAKKDKKSKKDKKDKGDKAENKGGKSDEKRGTGGGKGKGAEKGKHKGWNKKDK